LSILSRIKPSRSAAQPAEIVTDLDALIVKTVSIQWQGRAHVLKPISTAEFLRVTEALAQMDKLRQREGGFKLDELVDVYTDVIGSVCDTIDRREILKMSQAQVAALLQTVIDHVAGRVNATEKKTPVTPPKAG